MTVNQSRRGNGSTDTAAPATDSQWRSARRSAIRQHHPDVGGNPENLAAALAAVDSRFGHAPSTSQGLTLMQTARGRRAARRRLWGRRLRTARSRLPRRPPWAERASRSLS
ncbi:MAG: hypothetical protein ACR2KG_12400 [Nocardioidaceae bacterium]